MPNWEPTPLWQGKDVFIIGGGSSLQNFKWDCLRDELTIGCNSAYLLGKDICKICIFGDTKFYDAYSKGLESYGGPVFASNRIFQKNAPSWLYTMPRQAWGLFHKALGWNNNTGASAINLALILGAKNVYLLGFDLKLSKAKVNNWHNKGLDNKKNESGWIETFRTFQQGFKSVCMDWKTKFRSVGIYNITDDSDLNVFPKIPVKEFWSKRCQEQQKKQLQVL